MEEEQEKFYLKKIEFGATYYRKFQSNEGLTPDEKLKLVDEILERARKKIRAEILGETIPATRTPEDLMEKIKFKAFLVSDRKMTQNRAILHIVGEQLVPLILHDDDDD